MLELSKPENIRVIELKDGLFEEKKQVGFFWTFRLKAGKYYAELEDKNGTFFRGPEKAVQISLDGKPFLYGYTEEGGIWVAKCGNTVAKYKIEVYRHSGVGANSASAETTDAMNSSLATNPPANFASGVGTAIGFGIVGLIINSDIDEKKVAPTGFAITFKKIIL